MKKNIILFLYLLIFFQVSCHYPNEKLLDYNEQLQKFGDPIRTLFTLREAIKNGDDKTYWECFSEGIRINAVVPIRQGLKPSPDDYNADIILLGRIDRVHYSFIEGEDGESLIHEDGCGAGIILKYDKHRRKEWSIPFISENGLWKMSISLSYLTEGMIRDTEDLEGKEKKY